MEPFFLRGTRVGLRSLEAADADGPYPGWLNDEKVCKYNSHHVWPYDREKARAYIAASRANKSEIVLAVVVDDSHVGNVALQAIHSINRSAEFSILLGDSRCWGTSVGHEAGLMLLQHGFSALGLNRIACGTSADNEGMKKLAAKLGMREEGRRREAQWKSGRFVDVVEFGVLASEFRERAILIGAVKSRG